MKRVIAITGATGLLGRRVVSHLIEAGHEVVVLARDPLNAARVLDKRVRAIRWDGASALPSSDLLARCDTAVHLAGENIAARRWTPARRARLISSRVDMARRLKSEMERLTEGRLRAFVSASAVGIYGDRGDEALTEDSPRGQGFLADLCAEWERVARSDAGSPVRSVSLRFGVILARDGGALPKMTLPARFGLGGWFGDGRAFLSWVHIQDAARAVVAAVDHDTWTGPFNVVAPQPINNRAFTRAIGEVLARPCWAPVPAFALRLIFGEMADVLLHSQRAIPHRLIAEGFTFDFPEAEGALRDLLTERPTQ